MDLATALGLGIAPPPPADDSSHHSTTEACTLPAYLRAPEVTAQVMAEYIWLMGGTGQLRSKTKVLDAKPSCAEEAPIMIVESNPDGQLAEPNHELFLKPRKIFRDPFRGGDHILVLCDTFIVAQVVAEPGAAPSTVLQPSETNSRVACENVLRVAEQQEPVFAVEQEYAIIHPAYPTKVPLGPRRPSTSRASSCHSGSRRSSYVSSGSARGGIGKNSSHHGGKQSHAAAAAAAAAVAGIPWPSPDACEQTAQEASAARQKASRQLADSHLRCCLFAGVKVTGADVHSLDGLHSYKIGPSPGVDLGDDLWTSRYLLQRVAEQHSASVSWDPDSMPSERPLGCHFKYSTAATRQAPHGLNAIEQQLVRLQATHVQHQVAYNDGRLDRLSSPEASTFTHAVGSANASVVVPSLTFLQQGGYFTDRRPPSDADPYKVTLLLAATTLDIPLPKLPASSSAGNTAANCRGGMSAGPSSCPAAAALPFGSPMQSYLLAAAAAQRQQQQHLMFDTESEECDSVDEDDAMTEDSAALLAKMDDDGGAAEASSCDSDFEDQDDASSSPITGTWADNDCTHMLGAGI